MVRDFLFPLDQEAYRLLKNINVWLERRGAWRV